MNKAKLEDNIRILGRLTPSRIANAMGVYVGYLISRLLKRPSVWAFPISVSIEPTTSCNLRCPECPSGLRSFSRPTGMLEVGFYKSTIDQLASRSTYLTFYFQGEPYLNPNFLEMVQYARKKKLYTATSTNAHYLDDEKAKQTVLSGLDRLIVSIDGTTQETYEQYRIGGKLEKVLEGTRNVIKWKRELKSKSPHVIFQFLVVKPNEHQLGDIQKIAEELGVDEVRFKTAQVYDYKNGNSLIPDNESYARYKKLSDGTYQLKNKMVDHCWRLWSSCVITWDGKVVPCCFDKDAKHQMGELNTTSFKEIWKSKPYNNFRSAVLRSRKEIDICSNCSEGTKVWA